MQNYSLAILAGAGLIVASGFIIVNARPAVAQTPTIDGGVSTRWQIDVANWISQMGFRGRPFDAQRAQQRESEFPRIS